ncbi:MAG TPA: ABC transporter permease [Bacteroidales bacterium]|nr:ABC transporter permease [Bacteroidales bacterium]
MLRSFLIISFRNLSRQKGFSLINILGLTLGLTIGFLIILYIFNEVSYDRFHKDYDRIYRVAIRGKLGEMPINVAVTPGALGHTLKKELPEIEDYTMFFHVGGSQLMRAGDKKFYDNHMLYADTGFFRIFTFKMIYGDQATALSAPYSVVLTQSLAMKYFGDMNPVGETIRLNNQYDLTVTGVIEDPGDKTHLAMNMLTSFLTYADQRGPVVYDDWGSMMFYTYLKLKPETDPVVFERKISRFLDEYSGEDMEEENIEMRAYLQPLKDIHLHSNLIGEIRPNGDVSYVYILLAIALGILLIAGVNFMNLSTARSANRAMEVSIRKIMGADRKQLVFQFLGESVFLSLFGLVFALALIEILLPTFNQITGKSISVNYLENWKLLVGFGLIALLLGLFSGSYPALYLSSFEPVRLLRSKLPGSRSNKLLRNVLVLVQFTISAGLIISTLIIYRQLDYIRGKRLGFDKDNVITIFLRNEEIRKNAKILKEQVSSLPGIRAASLASSVPGMSLSGASYYPEGYNNEPWLIYNFDSDEDFVENTLRMQITEGRNFSGDFPSDSSAVIINETLAKKLDWTHPLGKIIRNNNVKGKAFHVIGVVKDFHYRSLHELIGPTLIFYKRDLPGFLVVRLKTGQTEKTIKGIAEIWNGLNPELPFDYEFMDTSFSELYSSEQKLGVLFLYLTIFAIFIASLGLLGLASFTAEQRTKEVGIRKALGASILEVSKLLSIEYLRLIFIANIVAWPLSYYMMELWLRDFSYRTSIPFWAFPVTGLFTLLPALIIINAQTIRTASANPVEALRYE